MRKVEMIISYQLSNFFQLNLVVCTWIKGYPTVVIDFLANIGQEHNNKRNAVTLGGPAQDK